MHVGKEVVNLFAYIVVAVNRVLDYKGASDALVSMAVLSQFKLKGLVDDHCLVEEVRVPVDTEEMGEYAAE